MRILMLFFITLNCSQLAAQDQITLTSEQLANLAIELGKAELITSIPVVEATAEVSIPPVNEYLVSTTHAGLVSQLKASIGDDLVKGQVLALIKSPQLLELQQRHLKSLNEFRLAHAEYQRDEKLYRGGVIADRKWLQSKVNYQVASSQRNETRQLLEIAGVSKVDITLLESKRKLTSQLKITAPISGVLLERMITTGGSVEASTALFRIADLTTLWLDIQVPQQRIQQVNTGDDVTITGMDKVNSQVFLIGQNVNQQNQTVLVRAKIKSPENIDGNNTVRLGQTVNVQINQKSTKPVFKVPNTAVAQSGGNNYLFVRNESGFVVKTVEIIARESQYSIIHGQLQENLTIAVKGAVALKANFLGLGEE